MMSGTWPGHRITWSTGHGRQAADNRPGSAQGPGRELLLAGLKIRRSMAGVHEAGDGGIVTGLTCLEICAGAGGQSLGLEQAGFAHEAAVELDPDACETLRLNRGSEWKIIEGDIRDLDGQAFTGIDLFSGGLPCPPFSIAGKQLGDADDRDLFPPALRLIRDTGPRAVLLENVKGLAGRRFDDYRAQILQCLHDLGYRTWWDFVQASMHGVPQLRPRFVLVAIREPWAARFRWPAPSAQPPPTVGDALHDLMSSRGWPGARAWRTSAGGIAPTIVGGSKKHGGPDLGSIWARPGPARHGDNCGSTGWASPMIRLDPNSPPARCPG
jgi:DNA (cytosine-5)-methyltransferase 1